MLRGARQELSALQVEHTVIQVEEKAAHVFVIHFPSSVRFVLRNDLRRDTGRDGVGLGDPTW